jgi:hypothetical protein
MERKEKSKVICKHLSRSIFGFKDNESVYVAAVMDGLKEIENIEREECKRQMEVYKKYMQQHD